MKKLLALVLALVMSMSLVTISNAADFTDADDIDYTEAVEVLNAVGVLVGSDGKFNPQGNLTRAQACKIIAYLDLGEDVAEALPSIKVFSDVPADNWAAKFVAYCADAGYVSGIGDGKFDPNANVTGYQFGKMLLCALGYDATVEVMTGASWQINVAKLMEENDIAKGVAKLGSLALTREEAAQYALNALKATCVEYDDKGTVIEGNGLTITTGAKKAESVTKAQATKWDAIDGATLESGTKSIVQLGEKLYKGDLTYAAGPDDGFGRATKVWKYDNEEIITVAKDATLTYTEKKDSSKSTVVTDVKNELIAKSVRFNTSSTTLQVSVPATAIFKNGTASQLGSVATVEDLMNLTANGKQVEIFIDKDAHKITSISVVEYTVGQVTDIKEGLKNAEGSIYTQYVIKPIAADSADTLGGAVTKVIFTNAKNEESDTIDVYANIAEDDIVTYVADKNGNVTVYATSVATGKQSAYTSSALTIAGTSYKVALGVKDNGGNVVIADFPNSKDAANYYLDQFGYVVKTNAVASTKEYCVMLDVAALAGVGAKTEAKLLFQDGSTKVVVLDKVYVDGSSTATALTDVTTTPANFLKAIYTYSVNDDGEYTLKEAMPNGESADSGKATSGTYTYAVGHDTFMTRNIPTVSSSNGTLGSFVVDNKTVVVVATTVDGDKVYTAYTGYAAMPTVKLVSGEGVAYDYIDDTNGAVVFAYVDATAIASVTDETSKASYVYVTDNDTKTVLIDSTNYYVSTVDNYNGETEITTASTVGTTGLFKVTSVNSKGVVTLGAATDKFTQLTVSADASNGILKLSNGNSYIYDGTETVIVIAADGSVSSGAVGSVVKDDTYCVYVRLESGAAAGTYPIDTLYVVLN